LNEPLVAGNEYQISLFVQRAEGSFYATPFGIHLSNSFLEQEGDALLDVDPNVAESPLVTDTTWQEISNFYTASGGEQHLTIGNFRSNAEMELQQPGNFPTICNSLFTTDAAYYFIDAMYIGEPLNTDGEVPVREFSVFPNPCIDSFTIEMSNDRYPAKLEILDPTGRLIRSDLLDRKRNAIKTSGLPNGTLILRVTDRQGVISHQRLVIAR
jgi:hypothetical protein